MTYLKRLDYSGPTAAQMQIDENHRSNAHALVFKGFPVDDNDEILELSRRLGPLSDDGIKSKNNQLEQDIIHLVTANGTLVLDGFGNQITSTTERALHFHTDEFFSQQPAELVLLACVQKARSGGESLVVSAETLAQNMPAKLLDRLGIADFPCHCGKSALFWQQGNRWTLRFNRLELDRAIALHDCDALDPDQVAAVDMLESVAAQHAERFVLEPGDLLVLNNTRSLHGRTAFPKGDCRKLKRVRIKRHLSA